MTGPADAAAARAQSRLVLLRHGETEWSRSGRHTSVTDLPLTPRGEEQARGVGAAIAGQDFGLVLSSPLRRAAHTARIVTTTGAPDSERELADGAAPVIEFEPDLTEWDYGAYEGLTSEQIVDRLGHDWSLWSDGAPSGENSGLSRGESPEEVRARVLRVIERVQPVLDRGEDVLAVAHGHVLRALVAAWLGLPIDGGAGFSLATGTLSELGFEHDRRVVLRWNCPPS